MLRTNTFEVPYYIGHCKDHLSIKDSLLTIIDENNGEHSQFPGYNITKTDYYLKGNDPNFEQKYISIIHPYILKHLNECQIIKPGQEQEYFYWYNQYTKLSYHGWHDHQGIKWASIYYLELSEDNPVTEFRNFLTQDVIRVNVKEGDIITFPGFMDHRSPPNLSGERKTIIACNLKTIY